MKCILRIFVAEMRALLIAIDNNSHKKLFLILVNAFVNPAYPSNKSSFYMFQRKTVNV